MNQLDFPVNEMMFIIAQYKIIEKFPNKYNFLHMKLRFHAIVAKEQVEVWSLIKIVRVISVTKDVMFENSIQNFRYHVVRENNVAFDFSVADFPLMNLNDLIQVALIIKDMDSSKLQGTRKEVLRLGLGHNKIFIDSYYDFLALTDIELSIAMGKEVKADMEAVKSQAELKKFADGEICLKPIGMLFLGKDKKGKAKRFLFQAFEVERYTTAQYTNFIVRMNNCKKNNEGDKAELKKVMTWYSEIHRMMYFAAQILIN